MTGCEVLIKPQPRSHKLVSFSSDSLLHHKDQTKAIETAFGLVTSKKASNSGS